MALLSRFCSCSFPWTCLSSVRSGLWKAIFPLVLPYIECSITCRSIPISPRALKHTHIFANQATPTARVDQSKISSNCCCQKMSSICQLSLLIMSEFSSGRRESGLLRFSSILEGLCNVYYAHWEYTMMSVDYIKNKLIDWFMTDGRHIWLTKMDNVKMRGGVWNECLSSFGGNHCKTLPMEEKNAKNLS